MFNLRDLSVYSDNLVLVIKHVFDFACTEILLKLLPWLRNVLLVQAQKAEKDATELKGSMRKRMEFLDLD